MVIQQAVREKLAAAIKDLFALDLTAFAAEIPPRTELGDLAFPVAFELAKRLKAATGQKQNPRDIAAKLAEALRGMAGIVRVEIAGAGYLNLYFDRANYVLEAAREDEDAHPVYGGKLIVEHTSVNPNKAAHIGHLRNAILGDTVVRILRQAGETVEVQNYIDNTGVQVADVVVGFKHIEKLTLDEVKRIPKNANNHAATEAKPDYFDYLCWDLYAKVGQFYEEDKSRLAMRAATLHDIESGTGETYELADYVATRILHCHLDTMLRLGIKYDVMPRESDVLHLHIWDKAFALLKERGAIAFESEGRLAGCWVMRSADEPAKDEAESEHEADKVIVRSNGTVTYTGKDIAYHLWKLGQLDIDFGYKKFTTYPDGHMVWITTANRAENDATHPAFGNGAAYFNVIDIGQSYPQRYVKIGVTAILHDGRVERSAHLAYEKVALTPAAAKQLGQQLSEEDEKRGAVSMSGRKGLGVKADDLIEQLEANALSEVASRHPELDETEQKVTAHQIAIGALRYFLLKYSRNSIISFDFKEALSFDGETGPYIQYAVVRANSIFRKLEEAGIDSQKETVDERLPEILAKEDELWGLLYFALRMEDVIQSAANALEPAFVAKWAFQLAQQFNAFYNNDRNRILEEPDIARRDLLVIITGVVRRQLISALTALGIEAPERM
ncbi:MAG: arginine--tRNA ligase [Acidobacteria bacterium]|nr:arginine--tRNA ligase [Acidobacteriota bacterium]